MSDSNSKYIDFKINGGRKLSGSTVTNTSKNGAMGLLCASLLNRGTTTLHGIPKIQEVFRILEVLESIGVEANWIGESNSLKIKAPENIDINNINRESGGRTRTVIMFLGPLIHRFKKFKLPHSQGCNLGKRTVVAHLHGLEKMGVHTEVTDFNYEITVGNLKPTEIVMYEAGDTATENLLLAAALIPGKTTIKFASSNYMVQDVCFFLEKLGVKIEGIGTSTITVYGVEEINMDVEHYNSEDPIEAMMFLSAAICTKSELEIRQVPIDFLELELLRLEDMGLKYDRSAVYKSKNNKTNLVDLKVYPSQLKASDEKITCGVYPNINMDNLPFFVPIACQAEGSTLIHDWAYENRAIYFLELNRLNANIKLADPHRVFVNGPIDFQPAQVVCPPALRPAMIVMIGMLAAPGESILRNVYSIRRGYEEIAERLNRLGASVEVI